MASLYELNGVYETLYNAEIDDDVLNDTLESLEGDYTDKVEGYIKVIKNYEADAEMFSNAEREFKEKKQNARAKIEKLKSTLVNSLKTTNHHKVDTGMFKVSIGKSKAVKIDDESEFIANENNAEYLKPQAPKIDKTAIKNAIKNGLAVEGAEIVENEGLRVR